MAVSTLDLCAWQDAHDLHPEDDYADEVNKLRIVRVPDAALGDPTDYPWAVDGINTNTGQVSMWMQSYPTFEAAVADLPALWREYVTDASDPEGGMK